MSASAFAWNPSLLPYAVTAAGMLGVNALVLLLLFPRSGGTPRLSRAILASFVLLSSTVGTGTFLYAAAHPSFGTATAVLFASQVMMVAPFVWVVALFYRGGEKRISPESWFWPLVVGAGVVGNEILMGGAFTIGAAGSPLPLDPGGPWGLFIAFTRSVASPWFFWPMAADVGLLLFWVRLPWTERGGLLGLALTALLGPWVLVDPLVAGIGMAVLMPVTLYVLYRGLVRAPLLSRWQRDLTLGVVAGFFLMALGEAAGALDLHGVAGPFVFAVLSVAVMLGEVVFLLRRILRPVAVPTQGTQGEGTPSAASHHRNTLAGDGEGGVEASPGWEGALSR